MMLLHCPTCFTGYDVPERCGGRRLRCAHCRTEWRPSVEPPAPPLMVAEPELVPEVGADDGVVTPPASPSIMSEEVEWHDPRPRPERRTRAAAMLAACWMLTVGTVGGGAYAAIHWRGVISNHWPPSQRIYGLLPPA